MTLYRQGKVPGSFYDGFGQEAVSAGAAFAMAAEDRLCILHRDLGRAPHPRRDARRGSSPSTWAARAASPAGARATSTSATGTLGCVGMVSMLPDMMLVAAGMAMAFKLRGERRCAMTWFGDGSTSRGDFHEAMNWAGVQKLPVIFVLENNQYAYSTPLDQQFAVDPVERAAAYGFPGVTVDGNDAEAMFEATRAGARARAGGRRPDADRGGDHAHARPRRPRRHEVRAQGAGRGVARARTRSTARPSAAGRARRRRRRAARRGQGRDRRGRRGGAGDADARPGDRDRRLFCEGEARVAGRRARAVERVRRRRQTADGSGGRPDGHDDLPPGDLRRPARGDARRRARAADGRGHRRLRRRLQGHRRLHRGVRRRRA